MDIRLDNIERILKEIPSNIFFKDLQCRYVFCTHYWEHINHGNDDMWDINGKTDLEIRKDKNNAILAMNKDKEIIRTGKGCRYVIEEKVDGKIEYLELIKNPVKDEQGNVIGIVGLINNITENVMLRQSLEVYANTDIMTGIYNRNGFEEAFNKKIGNCNLICTLIVISCIYDSETEKNVENEGMLLASNAIRIPITDNKICGKIDDNIFAVAVFSERKTEQQIKEIVSAVEQKIKLGLGSFYSSLNKVAYKWKEYQPFDNITLLLNELSQDLKDGILFEQNRYLDYRKQMKKIRKEIMANPENNWDIDSIIKSIGVSKSHFHRIYKMMFNESCRNEIINARIDKARSILHKTNLSINEVALMCGYKNNSHFMRQFKNRVGITAKEFRKQQQKG